MEMAIQTITGRRGRLELLFLFAAILGVCYLIAAIVDIASSTASLYTWVYLAIAFQTTAPGSVGMWASLRRRDLVVRTMLYPIVFGYTSVVLVYLALLLNPESQVPVFFIALVITICCGAIAECGYRFSAFSSGDVDRNRLETFNSFMEEQSEKESEMKTRLAAQRGGEGLC